MSVKNIKKRDEEHTRKFFNELNFLWQKFCRKERERERERERESAREIESCSRQRFDSNVTRFGNVSIYLL